MRRSLPSVARSRPDLPVACVCRASEEVRLFPPKMLSIDHNRNDEVMYGTQAFREHEAISSAVPADEGFEAVIAVKRRGTDENAHIFKVANGRRYDLASEADVAAEAALAKVREVSDEGELIWEENAI